MYDDNDDIATMGRSNIITMDSEISCQHDHEKGSPGAWRLALFLRVLFLYQVWSHLYLSLWYLVPFLLQDFQPWLQHCFNAFACYLCAALMANWLCIIYYRLVQSTFREQYCLRSVRGERVCTDMICE